MLEHIRPHQLFTRVDTPDYGQRLVSVVLPDARTPMLLETAVLLALIRLLRPRRVFEFGSFLGIQTLNMAANLAPEARVYTLDLDEAAFAAADQLDADRAISERHLANRHHLAFAQTPYADRVHPLYGDSNAFDFTPYRDTIDLVYVDGGHDARTVASDTRNAFAMLAGDHPAAICWHDYGNPTYPAVTALLEKLAEAHDLYHIEGTMICLYLAGLDALT